jgi:DNA-binding response OmpR family regulator
MSRLLIIDDDKELASLLSARLLTEGFSLDAVYDGRKGLEAASTGRYALIILDLMLPRMGGMEVLKALRQRSTIPVLMLTARGDDVDRILGLELGADDYLPKPFNPRELMARIRAILRRFGDNKNSPDQLNAGDITIDVSMREAHFNGKDLQLTTVEFAILETFMRNVGKILTRDYLTDAAMGRCLGTFDRSVDVHISNLRKKLSLGHGIERIKTVRGSGYLLTPRAGNENR